MTLSRYSRRGCLITAGVAAFSNLAPFASATSAADARSKPDGVTFSFGTYGMRSLKTERAVKVIAEVGFDGVELAVRPDWDSAPSKLTRARRVALRRQLIDSGLQVTALMEDLRPSDDDRVHAQHVDRLERAFELARDLEPERPPVVQTILGGGKWEEKKSLLAKRVGDWTRLAERRRVLLCIKPHRGGVMSRPAEAVWLINQLGSSPWLRMVYDYSHYAFRDMTIESTVKTAVKFTGHVAIKDTIRRGAGTTFVLPGAGGTIDYLKLFQLLHAGGYRRDICCEVSSAVWRQPDYDPLVAARTCYNNIAPLFARGNIPRRKR